MEKPKKIEIDCDYKDLIYAIERSFKDIRDREDDIKELITPNLSPECRLIAQLMMERYQGIYRTISQSKVKLMTIWGREKGLIGEREAITYSNVKYNFQKSGMIIEFSVSELGDTII